MNGAYRTLARYTYAFSLLWALFGLLWFYRVSPYRTLYSVTGASVSGVLLVSAYYLDKRREWARLLALTTVGATLLVSIFDEIGWIDVAYIVTAAALLIRLLRLPSTQRTRGTRKKP